MDNFTQIVFVIGKVTPNHIGMLGTGFLLSKDGKIGTNMHVVGSDPKNIVILMPKTKNINDYQDISDKSCIPVQCEVLEMDPIRDLCILQSDLNF